MDIISSRELLLDAQRKGYAVPAFNIHNLETFQAVIDGVVAMKSPVIIATTPGTVNYAEMEYLVAISKAAAKKYEIPIALHLDHCTDLEFLKECVRAGYKSVMIDASMEDFQKNVDITKEAISFAHRYDATVEAELGKLGGQEDDIIVDEKDSFFTDPDMALEFVKQTGVDSLAVAIGTAHGVYKKEPKLDFERLEKMNAIIDIPLVLHGASGVDSASVKRAIENGICKVNIATELKIPYSDTVKQYFKDNPEANDPRNYLTPAKEKMTQVVIEKIKMCGSLNRV